MTMTRYLGRVADFFVGLVFLVLVAYVPGTATLWLLRLLWVASVVLLALYLLGRT